MLFRRKDDCFNLKGQLLLDQPIKLKLKQSSTKVCCRALVLSFSRQQLRKLRHFVEDCWVCFWERNVRWRSTARMDSTNPSVCEHCGSAARQLLIFVRSVRSGRNWRTNKQTDRQTHKPTNIVVGRADASSTSVMGALRAPLTGQRREEVVVVVIEEKVVVVGVVVD